MHWPTVPALILLLQVPASATVLQEHSQRPYPVQAAPGQTLRQALQAATPIVVDGRRFHGYTRWNVRWNYRWWREASGALRNHRSHHTADHGGAVAGVARRDTPAAGHI